MRRAFVQTGRTANLSTREGHTSKELDLHRVMEDLTLLLMHLSSWRESASADLGAVRSWKGYDFGVLDGLTEKGYIYGSRSAKSVTLTDEGVREAERLKETFIQGVGEMYMQQDAAGSSTRSKARAEVEFFCKTCQSLVEAPSGYEPLERYCEGKMARERLMELVRAYHVRHWHTDSLKMYRDRFAYNVRKGMEFEEAAAEAKDYAQKMVPEEGRPAEDETAGPGEK